MENDNRHIDFKAPAVFFSEKAFLLFLALFALILSGIHPTDRFTWFLEISWVPAGILLLFATNKIFPLTPLAYRLLFIHAMILVIGGHYTYEKVPAGLWAKDFFGSSQLLLSRIHDRELEKLIPLKGDPIS